MNGDIEKKLETFFSKFKTLRYKKGEAILRPEDPISGINFLREGFIRQYVISKDGNELTIHIFRPNSLFPMMLVIADAESHYFFEAINSVRILRAPVDKTLEFIKSDSELLFYLAHSFASGLNGIVERMEHLMFEDAYRRVATVLLYLAKSYGEKEKKGIVIKLPLVHKDIAGWVNLTRETTSRQLEKLTKQNIIEHRSHVIIINKIKALERLAL